jgi:signal transduction histidine kinase
METPRIDPVDDDGLPPERIQRLLEEARADARSRLMREIHDGVGAQLTGLPQQVERPPRPRAPQPEQVQQAVDDPAPGPGRPAA